MLNFRPKKFLNYLPQGTYQGFIDKLVYYEEKGYIAMNILLPDNQVFAIAFANDNIIINNYLFSFANENGCLDETQIIDTEVKFSVIDNKKSGELKSRVTALEPVYED